MTEPEYRIVTPEQLKAGYVELNGVVVHQRTYTVVYKRPDGNYVVLEPKRDVPQK